MSDKMKALIEHKTKATSEVLAERHPGFSVGRSVIIGDEVHYDCIVHDGTGKNHRRFTSGVELPGIERVDEMLIENLFRNVRMSEFK